MSSNYLNIFSKLNKFDINLCLKQFFSAIKEKMDSLRPQSSCFIFTSRSSKSYKMEEMSLGTKDSLPTCIIIDCSMLSYVDITGVTTLKKKQLKNMKR
jgi:hypothetical protein